MIDLLRRARGNRLVQTGVAIMAVIALIAIIVPPFIVAPDAMYMRPVEGQFRPPSLNHLFGTDFFSRDIFSRVLYGIKISLSIAALSMLVTVTIGTAVGLIAGYVGGVIDTILMRIVDAALAIPRLLLLLVVLALWIRVDIWQLALILGLTSWFGTSRLVRAEVLSIKHRDYIVAAQALGVTAPRTLLRHLLPNVLAPITVTAALGMGQIILIEAAVSYLGVGLEERTASLGKMIADGFENLTIAPWVSLFPGIALVLLVIGFSFIGDGLRDVVDPRTR